MEILAFIFFVFPGIPLIVVAIIGGALAGDDKLDKQSLKPARVLKEKEKRRQLRRNTILSVLVVQGAVIFIFIQAFSGFCPGC